VGVFNRRNAVIGWLTWKAGKRAVKYAAKDATKDAKPALHPATKKPNKSAIALLVAGGLGALTFWKKRSGGNPPDSTESDSA
jgi:hypothetical protein